MFDLRRILDRYRIVWKDKGANCSKGFVNITCPFCRLDPSYHLQISEDGSWYHCWRNQKHSGSVSYLFKKLSIPAKELEGAVRYNRPDVGPHPKPPQDLEDFGNFHSFQMGTESTEVLTYLESRDFRNPKVVCSGFNLRFAPVGKWAGRLLIPLSVGWTGRSMREHIEPRYLANTNEDGFFFYTQKFSRASSVIVCEGALDAIRIATSTESYDVVGKCGGALSAALRNFLTDRRYINIYNCPDEDVPAHRVRGELTILSFHCMSRRALWLKLPQGVKDAGKLSESEARGWLTKNPVFLQ